MKSLQVKEIQDASKRFKKAYWVFLGVRTIDFVDVSYMVPINLILTGDFGTELQFAKSREIFALRSKKSRLLGKIGLLKATTLNVTFSKSLLNCLRKSWKNMKSHISCALVLLEL